jgi:hypothetical protein
MAYVHDGMGVVWGGCPWFHYIFSKSILDLEYYIHFQPWSIKCTLYTSHYTTLGKVLGHIICRHMASYSFTFLGLEGKIEGWNQIGLASHAFGYFSTCQFFGWQNGNNTSNSSQHQFYGTSFMH